MSYNDDDWYEFTPENKFVRSYSPRAFTWQRDPIKLPNGNFVVKGMRAKWLGL